MSTVDDSAATDRSNEGLVAAFLTAFVGGDGDAIADLVTDDCVLHQPRWPKDHVGRDAIVAETATNEGTFDDLEMVVERSVTDGETVAAQVTASGRNVGPLRVEDREVAPSGRRFRVPQFGFYRVANGQIAEAWVLADALGIVEQLGTLPNGPGAMVRILLRQVGWRLGGRRRLD